MLILTLLLLWECSSCVKANENIAFNKYTQQSSKIPGAPSRFEASLAVDGDPTCSFNAYSCTHTVWENNAWWMVDLQGVYHVTRIVLYGRTDCCTDRFSNFDVDVIKPGGCTNLCHYQIDDTTFLDVTCPPNTVGRYVRIRLRTNTALTICEAEVYGEPYIESTGINSIFLCIANGHGYLGSAITTTNTQSKFHCIILCINTPGCVAAEFQNNAKVCTLKTTVDIQIFYTDANAFYSDPNNNVYLID